MLATLAAPVGGQKLQMGSDVRLQLRWEVLPARTILELEWRFDQRLLRPAFDGPVCIPGAGDRPTRLVVDCERRGLLPIGHVGVDDRFIDRGRFNSFEAAVADQPGQRRQPEALLDAAPQLPPQRRQRRAAGNQVLFVAKPEQRGFGIGLVVRQRLPLNAAIGVMELIDVQRHRAPARRDAFRRPIQRLGDDAQRAAPVRPLGRRQHLRFLDRRDGVREGGFE